MWRGTLFAVSGAGGRLALVTSPNYLILFRASKTTTHCFPTCRTEIAKQTGEVMALQTKSETKTFRNLRVGAIISSNTTKEPPGREPALGRPGRGHATLSHASSSLDPWPGVAATLSTECWPGSGSIYPAFPDVTLPDTAAHGSSYYKRNELIN